MKRYILTIVILISFMPVHAQLGGINDPIREVFPTTPNASEMTQYGKIAIGEFTGTMQHSIPLYEINYKGINIPITLNYSSNGVNIDKFESSVGIDWNLNSGGVITRTLMDAPDEKAIFTHFPEPPYYFGSSGYNEILGYVNCNSCNLQPDIFNFNIMGYSGRFYIKNEGVNNIKVFLVDPSPVKIEILTGIIKHTNYNDNEYDIKITLPNGIKCFFGGEDAFDTVGSMTITGSNHTPLTVMEKNAFYLSRLEAIDGSFITFKYNNSNYKRETGISQSIKIKGIKQPQGIQYIGAEENIDNCFTPSIFQSRGKEIYISEIEWNQNKIEFSYNQKLLTQIQIKSNENNIEEYLFNYQEKEADSLYQTECSFCDYDLISKRNFLTEITKVNYNEPTQNEIVLFEYYNPEQLPQRLSYSRDYWGYFNGKPNQFLVPDDISNFNQNGYFSDGSLAFNYSQIQELFSTVGGDRNTDPDYAVYGLLKKIIYPTKGWTEIEYDANSYYGEIIIPGEKELVQLGVSKTDITHVPVTDSRFITLPSDQAIKLIGSVTAIEPPYCEQEDTGHSTGTLIIKDVADNSIVFTHTFYPNDPPQYFSGQANHTYNFTLSVNWPCTSSTVTFFYEATAPTSTHQNIPYGGMRVKRIKNKDFDNNLLTQEEYLYGDLDCLECSESQFETLKPAISFYEFDTIDADLESYYLATLGSSTLNSLYFSNNTSIAYPVVSKRFIDSSGRNSGLIIHRYSVVFDNFPVIQEGDWIAGTSYTNGFGNGNLLKEEFYNYDASNNVYVLIKDKEHSYRNDNTFNHNIEGHNISLMKTVHITHGSDLPDEFLEHYNVNKYFTQSKRLYLDYTIEKEYTPNGIMETRTDYYYQGVNKLLKSKESTTGSDGSLLEITYSYPEDLLMFKPKAQELAAANRIADPLIVQQKVDGIVTMLKETEYGEFNVGNPQGSLILPKFIYTAKGDVDKEKVLTYDQYDDKGNLLQYTLANGTPVSIIWGYEGQYPIAKVEGKTYSSISSLANTLINLSNSGNLTANSFEALRNTDGAMVTGYIYKPLVGVTQIIHPNGQTASYEYDGAGRLQQVKDQDGKILKEVEYHYQPQ